MKTLRSFLGRRIREYAYLLTTFPIAVALFVLVQVGFSSALVPVAVLLLLGLLTAMERVARFEIRRTNWFLGTDFRIVDGWFGKPFFSWEGAKERVTSPRGWMAIAYVFVAFGASVFGFAMTITGLAVVVVLLAGTGLVAIAPFTRVLEITSVSGANASLQIEFVAGGLRLQLLAVDGVDRLIRTGSVPLDGALTIALLLAGALLLLWACSSMARGLARTVEGLLSGTYLPRIEMEVMRLTRSLRVSEREVREAMDQPALREDLAELSVRQREILALMAQGKSNAGIAKALYITEGSVEKHVSNILAKLELPPEDDSHRRVLAVLTYLGIDRSAQ